MDGTLMPTSRRAADAADPRQDPAAAGPPASDPGATPAELAAKYAELAAKYADAANDFAGANPSGGAGGSGPPLLGFGFAGGDGGAGGAGGGSHVVPVTPRNVVQAIAAVKAELEGIKKMTPEERRRRGLTGDDKGVNYAFRGIDQIAGALQQLEGKHGVVTAPGELIEREVRWFELYGKPWSDTTIRVRWHIYGPDFSYIVAETTGMGRDNADKGDNKAWTGARKNLLLTLYNIGDPADDGDNERHENEETPANRRRPRDESAHDEPPADDGPPRITDMQKDMIAEAIEKATGGEETLKTAVRLAWIEKWGKGRLLAEQFEEAWSWLHEELAKISDPSPDGGATLPLEEEVPA